jgi:hypothetical protein
MAFVLVSKRKREGQAFLGDSVKQCLSIISQRDRISSRTGNHYRVHRLTKEFLFAVTGNQSLMTAPDP